MTLTSPSACHSLYSLRTLTPLLPAGGRPQCSSNQRGGRPCLFVACQMLHSTSCWLPRSCAGCCTHFAATRQPVAPEGASELHQLLRCSMHTLPPHLLQPLQLTLPLPAACPTCCSSCCTAPPMMRMHVSGGHTGIDIWLFATQRHHQRSLRWWCDHDGIMVGLETCTARRAQRSLHARHSAAAQFMRGHSPHTMHNAT